MKTLAPGRGSAHPSENDCVRVRFTGWRRDGSIFSYSGLHGESDVQCLSGIMPGLVEALKEMAAGEKRRVWVPAPLTFIPQRRQEQTPAADLTFDLELVQIIRAPPVPKDLSAPPKRATRTPSGVAFLVLKKGHGSKHPLLTSKVTLHVSGWTSDGKLFQSTQRGGQPALYLVGDTPAAWREVLQRMVVGERVRLWVPPPAGGRVYEIELVTLP